jgi:hypothetical protein
MRACSLDAVFIQRFTRIRARFFSARFRTEALLSSSVRSEILADRVFYSRCVLSLSRCCVGGFSCCTVSFLIFSTSQCSRDQLTRDQLFNFREVVCFASMFSQAISLFDILNAVLRAFLAVSLRKHCESFVNSDFVHSDTCSSSKVDLSAGPIFKTGPIFKRRSQHRELIDAYIRNRSSFGL